LKHLKLLCGKRLEYYYSDAKKREEDYFIKLKELFGDNLNFNYKNIDEISYEAVYLAFREKTKSLDVLMDRKFSKLFKLDEGGVPKRWKPTDNIQEQWLIAKEKVEPLIDLYSIIRIKSEDTDLSFF